MMLQYIEVKEDGLYMTWKVTDEGDIRFLHAGVEPLDRDTIDPKQEIGFRMLEVQATGDDRDEYHGRTHRATMPGLRMRYENHSDVRNEIGRELMFMLKDPITELCASCHFQFYEGTSVIKCWTVLENAGSEPIGIEYVSSFALTGFGKEGLQDRDHTMRLHIPHNSWQGEVQWRNYRLPELGLSHIKDRQSKRIAISNTGSWSSAEYIPMGFLENEETGEGLFWQIEHNGSWHCEIFDQFDQLAILISGPTESDNGWWKELQPGASFESVPIAFGITDGGFEEAIGLLTNYRRYIRRPNEDNRMLKIIFNDYMNCLWGNPTTERELPLIDAAAEAGCEYYCIDCGWYHPGQWWDNVGQWLPSEERFPEGIKYVLDYILSKGMIPGLWLEIEVMGIRSPKLEETTDDWFFTRHGKRIKDRSRYHLDFRNPAVIAHANEVIRRLVEDYGVGYIKMDYNINAGLGTELEADSFGDGLLEHNRAYLKWLDEVFAKYPELVIENCGSGGMRIDYALLSRHSIQSTSDQESYLRYAGIAASSPTALTPEQSAVWSYPLREGDEEEVVFNMVNALLLRVHQSGHLAELSKERFKLVKEALDYYKEIRTYIPKAWPFWPHGLPTQQDSWITYGLKTNDRSFLAVWRLQSGDGHLQIPLSHYRGCELEVSLGYPKAGDCEWKWNAASGVLSIYLPKPESARLFSLLVRD
ncbi:glycoside hydrolase family 36 protein [Paenibacillus urinalis]|uniref:glycoside hydrolase family 36 protein n=1 Tax=Paenibacillus urinalis TaxID=521520 RepID=UPI00363939FB